MYECDYKIATANLEKDGVGAKSVGISKEKQIFVIVYRVQMYLVLK